MCFLNHHHQQQRRMGQIKFLLNFERLAIQIEPNKRTTVAPLISHHSFNKFFSITTYNFFTTGSKLATARAFIFPCLYFPLVPSLLCSTKVLEKPCQGNFRKFQGSSESKFGSSEKDLYFLKIPEW